MNIVKVPVCNGDYLCVLTSNDVIAKMLLDGSACNIKYNPWEIEIDYLFAIKYNVILISEGGRDDRILEYNTETNQVIQRVSGKGYPGKVSVLQAGYDTKYIVKCYQPKSDLWLV